MRPQYPSNILRYYVHTQICMYMVTFLEVTWIPIYWLSNQCLKFQGKSQYLGVKYLPTCQTPSLSGSIKVRGSSEDLFQSDISRLQFWQNSSFAWDLYVMQCIQRIDSYCIQMSTKTHSSSSVISKKVYQLFVAWTIDGIARLTQRLFTTFERVDGIVGLVGSYSISNTLVLEIP